jgi:hypothetical protein
VRGRNQIGIGRRFNDAENSLPRLGRLVLRLASAKRSLRREIMSFLRFVKGELGRGLINGRQNTGANAQPNVRYWVKQTSFGIVAMPVNDPSATFADVLPVLLPTE